MCPKNMLMLKSGKWDQICQICLDLHHLHTIYRKKKQLVTPGLGYATAQFCFGWRAKGIGTPCTSLIREIQVRSAFHMGHMPSMFFLISKRGNRKHWLSSHPKYLSWNLKKIGLEKIPPCQSLSTF